MIKFGLIGAIADYAAAESMAFLFGESWYQNYEASQIEYADGQYILGCDFDARPSFGKGGGIGSVEYNGVLMLGIKFDAASTFSNLDETKKQKYDIRLESLSTKLAEVIVEIACANELDIINCIFRLDVNKFDENIDFVAATVTFLQ